ncbi:YheV family putative metal-binding protein [Vibrio sp. SS-MA-C1-2]|uniref:YheV family putative zinc ribbon protein n=1 Tax=Vibrio sp. SS-MA-C1-2 TaxID=2908646 RepID=UPI001F354CEF|nr:YheV family putative zinc ribbon protein [Vibrio sp. SS-MA-C1-2]UJF19206.1 YheV family putative metal-binding protein [Vibrio sp. SS-MA-C1-2]
MERKRFIAGATCPACQKEDTLRWWSIENIEHIECVACEHQDQRSMKSTIKSKEPSTEVSDQVIGIFTP